MGGYSREREVGIDGSRVLLPGSVRNAIMDPSWPCPAPGYGLGSFRTFAKRAGEVSFGIFFDYKSQITLTRRRVKLMEMATVTGLKTSLSAYLRQVKAGRGSLKSWDTVGGVGP